VTSAADWTDRQPEHLLNVALSFPGLRATGVLSEGALARFPSDFAGGANPDRLHDTGPPWWNGVAPADLHCLVSLHALTDADLDGLRDRVLAVAAATGTRHLLVRPSGQTIDGQLLEPPRRLHFGYLDGFSGPTVAWKDPAQQPDVDFRHFLLGYASDDIDSSPRDLGGPGDAEATTFARDGSYGVFRLMYQDVAAFNSFLAANAGRLAPALKMSEAEAAERLAAKMLGRWRDGRPLVLAPEKDGPAVKPEADFNYSGDAAGERCPFSAHIRVVNPRDQRIRFADAPVPRLLRRGMPYGPELEGLEDDGKDRGLIGLFLCANLRGQFEKLMDWINRNDFSSVFTDLRAQDPLLGNRDLPLASTEFLIPTADGPQRATGLTTFVRTRGTAYFLFPSLQALRQLGGR
jgi:Dyp-type peroxidase family